MQTEEQKNLCLCGCGKGVKNKFVSGHNFCVPHNRKRQDGQNNHFFGGKHSEETKARMRVIHSNRSEETRQRMSQSLMGRKLSDETKRKLSLRSSDISEETRNKMRKANGGKRNGMYGKRHSEEAKRKMADASSKVMHEEIKKKLSETNKRLWKENSSIMQKIMQHCGHKKFSYIAKNNEIIKMRSNWEVAYAQYLDSQNYIWRYEFKGFRLSNGHLYFPDFFVETLNEWHEVKGYLRKDALEKIKLFSAEYPNIKLKILLREDLLRLGVL